MPTSTSQTLDLYTTIATQIRVKLLGVPPPGYLTRLQVQWILCGLKFCLACTSMILTYLDLRRRGRRLRLVHFQRLQNGRILVLNSLFLYVLVSALSAVYFAFVRFQNWKVYYDGAHPRNLVMYTIQCWTPIYLAALVFTSGNVSALLMMSRSSRGFETASRPLILAQNGTLIGVLFLYFASTIPMSIVTNNRANHLIDDALGLMERLEAAGIASRAGMPVDTILGAPLGEILSQAQALQDREKGLNVWIDGLLAIAIFFCFFFACAAIASLRFVLRLRQESKKAVSTGEIGVAGSMALRSINVTREQAITIEHDANYVGLHSKVPLRSNSNDTQLETPRSFMPFSQGLMPSSPPAKSSSPPRLSAETIALARLSRDLMMATPLVLASCFILPCCAFWGWISTSDAWAMRELQLDGLVWPELIITNALLLFFVFNHLRNPARYGGGQPEEIKTIGGRIAPPGFEFRLTTQQERTNRQSDGADEVDRVYVANLTSHDGDITLAEPEKAWLAK